MNNLRNEISFSKSRTLTLLFTVIIILISSTQVLQAADTTAAATPKADISILNSGNQEDILFSVNYQTENEEILEFTITDTDGYVFYNQLTPVRKISKKFLFQDAGNEKVNLILTFKTRTGTQVQQLVLNN